MPRWSDGAPSADRVVPVDGEPVRLLEWPGEAPALLAWPGMGSRAEYFGLLAERLPNHLWAVDPPGVGPVSTGLPTVERALAIWERLLAETGAAVVVGHSWGAFLARLAQGALEATVRGAVLLDGGYMPWVNPGESLEAEIAEGLAFLGRQTHRRLEDAVAADLQAYRDRGLSVTPTLVRMVRSGWMRRDDGAWHPAMSPAAFGAAMRSMAVLPEEAYLAVAGRALLVTPADEAGAPDGTAGGEADRTAAQRREWLGAFARQPGHRVVTLAGLTHELLPEGGDEVARVIRAWLADLA